MNTVLLQSQTLNVLHEPMDDVSNKGVLNLDLEVLSQSHAVIFQHQLSVLVIDDLFLHHLLAVVVGQFSKFINET